MFIYKKENFSKIKLINFLIVILPLSLIIGNLATNITIILFILFLIVVTFIYHPPGKKMIPFMSNMCDIGAFILLLCLFNL